MFSATYRNMTRSFYGLMKEIRLNGNIVSSRGKEGMDTQEIHPAYIAIEKPVERVLLVPGRKNSLAATIYETFWVLAGFSNITPQFLGHYLKRAGDFSDDGITWRGAYGPRLRRFPNEYGRPIDQVKEVYNTLSKSLDSRQAVITIHDPGEDTLMIGKTKDIPCNNQIYFLVRDNKLDVTVNVRSNDLIWGYSSINVFEWTVLQEAMANLLGVEIGTYYHQANSLHIYQDCFERVDQMLKTNTQGYTTARMPLLAKLSESDVPQHVKDRRFEEYGGIADLQHTLNYFFRCEYLSRNPGITGYLPISRELEVLAGTRAEEYTRVVIAYNLVKVDPLVAASFLTGIQSYDLFIAAVSQLDRMVPGFAKQNFTSGTAYEAEMLK